MARLGRDERERLAGVLALEDSYVACRTFGHAWYAHEGKAANGTVPLLLRCERSATTRFDEISANSGQLVARSYTYPDGYQQTRGTTWAKDDWRKTFLVKAGYLR